MYSASQPELREMDAWARVLLLEHSSLLKNASVIDPAGVAHAHITMDQQRSGPPCLSFTETW